MKKTYRDTKTTIQYYLLIFSQHANYELHIKQGSNKTLYTAYRKWVCGNVKHMTFAV